MQIEINTTQDGLEYIIKHNQNWVKILCGDNNSVHIEGPLDLMLKAIGGRGLENANTSILTDKELTNSAIAISSVLEILNQVLNHHKKAPYNNGGPKE